MLECKWVDPFCKRSVTFVGICIPSVCHPYTLSGIRVPSVCQNPVKMQNIRENPRKDPENKSGKIVYIFMCNLRGASTVPFYLQECMLSVGFPSHFRRISVAFPPHFRKMSYFQKINKLAGPGGPEVLKGQIPLKQTHGGLTWQCGSLRKNRITIVKINKFDTFQWTCDN